MLFFLNSQNDSINHQNLLPHKGATPKPCAKLFAAPSPSQQKARQVHGERSSRYSPRIVFYDSDQLTLVPRIRNVNYEHKQNLVKKI